MVFHLKNSVGDGIEIFSNDNTIINNFIEPEFEGVVSRNTRSVIKGNTIVNAERGIRIDSIPDDNQILDNTIISSERSGIFVNGGKRHVIQGNTINQSGENGIEVDSSIDDDDSFISEDVIIKGNSITNSVEFGIEIDSESLNTVVIDNIFAGNGGDNLLNNGTDTVLAGNVPNLI